MIAAVQTDIEFQLAIGRGGKRHFLFVAFSEHQHPAPLARIRPLLLALYLASAALGLGVNLFKLPMPGWVPNPDSLLIASGALMILASLAARRLPLQNIIAIALLTGFAFPVAWMITRAADIAPLSQLRYSTQLAAAPAGSIPWIVPLLWILLIVGARETASLLLTKQRGRWFYGISLLLLAASFVILSELVLMPYAVEVKGYWSWENRGSLATGWVAAPWSYFVCSAGIATTVLFLVVPWFINKRQAPAKIGPAAAWVWLIFGAYLSINNWMNGPRFSGTAGLVATLLLAVLVRIRPQNR